MFFSARYGLKHPDPSFKSEERKMAGGTFSQIFANDLELTTSPLHSRRNSADSDTSWPSTLSGTLKENNSLLSCSESELSVRTGSTAYKPLPPRPAPPPPPPKSRTSPPKVYSLLTEDTNQSNPQLLSTQGTSIPGRRKTAASKTLPLKKKPHLERTLSSDQVILPQPLSLPVDQMSRTFSSDGLRRILYSLPPAYPPPPPPDSPLLPPYVSILSPSPTISPTPPVPSVPPLSPTPRFERRQSPSCKYTMSNLSTPSSESHQNEDDRGNEHTSCQSNTYSLERSKCHQYFLDNQCLVLISSVSFALSFACCVFTAYHFMYGTRESQKLQICLPRDSFKHYHRLLENLTTDDQTQYCANTNDEISDLIHAMFVTLENTSESRNVKQPKFQPISAHIQFLANNHPYNNNMAPSPERLVISQPDEHSKGPSRVHANHVIVTPEGLSINYTGMYFVYSSMHFKPRFRTPEYKIWEHIVALRKVENGSSEILTNGSHSCFDNCDSDVHTSYTGGIFKLQQADLVYVNVTSKDLVVPESQGSYLGLIMIGCIKGDP